MRGRDSPNEPSSSYLVVFVSIKFTAHTAVMLCERMWMREKREKLPQTRVSLVVQEFLRIESVYLSDVGVRGF